jgi:hypothetical protein
MRLGRAMETLVEQIFFHPDKSRREHQAAVLVGETPTIADYTLYPMHWRQG